VAEGDGKERTTGAHSATPDVFVSYASQDAGVANAVVTALEHQGLNCWLAPRNVKPGTVYADAIVGAINESKALVLVLSANAMASAHVGREIERAASKRKQLIAFRIDTTPLSRELEYFLSNSQWLDVPALGMPAALAKLKEAVGQWDSSPSVTPVRPMSGAGWSTRRIAIAGAAFGLLGAAVALGVHFWPSAHSGASTRAAGPVGGETTSAAASDKSIAVLPFIDMSEKHDREYFADGMAEEIIDLLAKIPGLMVIGRTSSFQFKGKNEDLRTIGTQLNAAYVLEGSVRNSGDQLRITAQLINTRTGTHEWSETYDRPIGDVLKLQDAIAAAVVREMQLTVEGRQLNSRAGLRSADAYDLILRGRHAVDHFDKEGLDEAVTLFQQALDRDPTSVDARAGLAYAYYNLGAYGFLAPEVAYERSRRAATDVLKLDPRNASAYWILGIIHLDYDWNWIAAGRDLEQVAALAPGTGHALNGKAWLSRVLGRWDEGLSQIKAALAQDPLNPDSYECLAWIQMGRAHLPDAEAAMRRALDIRPTYAWGHFMLGMISLERGDPRMALLEMHKEQQEVAQLSGLSMVYHALGKTADADAALTRLIKERANDDAFQIANVYAFRGQFDEAMRWLERAYVQKDYSLYLIKAWLPPSLVADPRYKAFLRKMNLPE
jgi:TolB-like protein/Tfp pilus assembly protein PilF